MKKGNTCNISKKLKSETIFIQTHVSAHVTPENC